VVRDVGVSYEAQDGSGNARPVSCVCMHGVGGEG
jgi:hypothetical protein